MFSSFGLLLITLYIYSLSITFTLTIWIIFDELEYSFFPLHLHLELFHGKMWGIRPVVLLQTIMVHNGLTPGSF